MLELMIKILFSKFNVFAGLLSMQMHPTLRWLVSSLIDVTELSFNMWNFFAVQSLQHQIMAFLFPPSMTWSTFTTWTLRFLFAFYLYFIMNFLHVIMLIAALFYHFSSSFSCSFYCTSFFASTFNAVFFPLGVGCFLDISPCNEAFQVSRESWCLLALGW